MTGLPIPTHLPAGTLATLVYRFIAAFRAHTVFAPVRWECRNGYYDTSGFDSGTVRDFDLFPGAQERRRLALPSDPSEQPAYRFWFLRKKSEPFLCLETTGVVWLRDGTQYDLVLLYTKQHSVSALVYSVAQNQLS